MFDRRTSLMAATARLRLTEVVRDSRIQPRERITATVVDEYAEEMAKAPVYLEAGLAVRPWPPIVVFHERGEDGQDLYWLADGWHRILAAEQAGRDEVEAQVEEGDRYAALLYAAGANTTHGLRRSTADKRRAVWLVLDHPQVIAEQWGNGRVAHHVGVSTWLVRDVRTKRDDALGLVPPLGRRGLDGKVYYRGIRLRSDPPPEAPESPLEGSTGPQTSESTSGTGGAAQRLLIHQCRTEGCDAVTTEPSWHCLDCGTHWPLAEIPEIDGCPSCAATATSISPVPIFAQVTAVDLPKPARNGHTQAPYTPGHLPPPEASLALERLRGALDLFDGVMATGVSGADLLAASGGSQELRARLYEAQAMMDRLVASLDVRTAV